MPVNSPLEAEEFDKTGVFKVSENVRANLERLLGGLENPLIQGPHLTSQLEKLHAGYEIDQGVEDRDELREIASRVMDSHDLLTKQVTEAGGGDATETKLKSVKSMDEKFVDHGDTYRKTGDVVRSSIVFDDLETLYLAVIELYKRAEIVRVKDRFINPRPSGYRDLLFNIKLKDPDTGEDHITEVQFQLRDIEFVKKHEYRHYKKRRKLEQKLAICRKEEPQDQARIKELETDIGWLERQSSVIFEDAWQPYEDKLDGYKKWAEKMVV